MEGLVGDADASIGRISNAEVVDPVECPVSQG